MKRFLPFLVLAAVSLMLTTPAPVSADDEPSLFGIELGLDLPWIRHRESNVIYESPRYEGDARLYVRDDRGRWRVYRGTTYQRIVNDNPDLGLRGSLEVLGQKIRGALGLGGGRERPASFRAGLQMRFMVPGMTYEATNFDDRARLYVVEDGHEYVYTGTDLDAIVTAHPELRQHASYAVLSTRINDSGWRWRNEPLRDGHQHLDIKVTPEGYRVCIWSYGNGLWTRSVYEGESLKAISQTYPEVNELLDAWTDEPSTDVDGAKVSAQGAVLVQAKRHGGPMVLVETVEQGSVAAKLGLQKGDFVLAVNDTPTEAPAEAAAEMNKYDGKLLRLKIERSDKSLVLSLRESVH